MDVLGAFFYDFGVEYLLAWQELQFGVFRFSVALLVPEIQSVILHRICFRFFFVFREKSPKILRFSRKMKKRKKWEP